jgi:hypothetical protein
MSKTPNTYISLSKKTANSNVCTPAGQSNPFWRQLVKPVKLVAATSRSITAAHAPQEDVKIYAKSCKKSI